MPFTVTLDFVEAFDSQIETECCPHLGVYLIFFFPLSSVKYLQYHAAFRKKGCVFLHMWHSSSFIGSLWI